MEGVADPASAYVALEITKVVMNTLQIVALTYIAAMVRRNGKE